MAHKMHVISCKILMMKSKNRKCYMYFKFYINPDDFVKKNMKGGGVVKVSITFDLTVEFLSKKFQK